MSLQNISPKKLAIIFIVAGAVIIFVLLGSSARSLFNQSVTEDVKIRLKTGSNCIVEPSDNVPRQISNCQYNVGDNLSVTYKPQQPSIEKYELK